MKFCSLYSETLWKTSVACTDTSLCSYSQTETNSSTLDGKEVKRKASTVSKADHFPFILMHLRVYLGFNCRKWLKCNTGVQCLPSTLKIWFQSPATNQKKNIKLTVLSTSLSQGTFCSVLNTNHRIKIKSKSTESYEFDSVTCSVTSL